MFTDVKWVGFRPPQSLRIKFKPSKNLQFLSNVFRGAGASKRDSETPRKTARVNRKEFNILDKDLKILNPIVRNYKKIFSIITLHRPFLLHLPENFDVFLRPRIKAIIYFS